VTLDAQGTTSSCPGTIEYAFFDPSSGLAQDFSTDPRWSADQPGRWTVEARCPSLPDCTSSASADVVLERRPTLGPASAVDAEPCALGIAVSWPAAIFPSGTGVYNVYRADTDVNGDTTLDCADALQSAPFVLGGTTWLDTATVAGTTYVYVVEAEDSAATTTCTPVGPGGGAVARSCTSAVTDVASAPPPAL